MICFKVYVATQTCASVYLMLKSWVSAMLSSSPPPVALPIPWRPVFSKQVHVLLICLPTSVYKTQMSGKNGTDKLTVLKNYYRKRCTAYQKLTVTPLKMHA